MSPETSSSSWWTHGDVLHRFISDLVCDELTRGRPGGAPLPPLPWPDDMRIDAAGATGLGADSLERLTLATALAEAIQLSRSGIEDYLLARHMLRQWVEIAAAGLSRFSEELVFRTSGSTGSAKPCRHLLSRLQQETAALAGIFAGRRRILLAVPSHHIYGFLFGVLLPRDLRVPVLDIRRSSPAQLGGIACAGDLIVAHPAFWSAAVRAAPVIAPGVVGVTSTAPCPAEVPPALGAMGLDRLVEVYGSSETAGIGWRDRPNADYKLFPYWHRAADDLVRRLADAGEERVVLPDQVIWTSNDTLRVGGRQDAAVQVGGINVFPARVREVLCRHPAVADAAVRLMQPQEGSRLKAFVVPVDPVGDADGLRAALAQWVDTELTAAERPKSFRFGMALPRNPMGKIADWSADAGAE